MNIVTDVVLPIALASTMIAVPIDILNYNPMIYAGAVVAIWKTLASRIIMMKRFRFSKVFVSDQRVMI